MNDAEKLIATIKAVRIPQAYDLEAWEADAIYEDAKLDIFRMLAQADERQLKLIAGFVRQLVKKGGAT